MFGADFERYSPDGEPPKSEPAPVVAAPTGAVDKAKKGKVAAKATGLQYQFQIMESIGVPRADIKKFADPLHWLEYFPPIARVSVICLTPSCLLKLSRPTALRLVRASTGEGR
jgi:leucyl-tRNA synthetase